MACQPSARVERANQRVVLPDKGVVPGIIMPFQLGTPNERARLAVLKGKVAIANAKLAYQRYKRLFAGERWEELAAKGAKPQRLLWASIGTKNKAYSDVLYVEELIGPNTISTIPPATLDAFRDHGKIRDTTPPNHRT